MGVCSKQYLENEQIKKSISAFPTKHPDRALQYNNIRPLVLNSNESPLFLPQIVVGCFKLIKCTFVIKALSIY